MPDCSDCDKSFDSTHGLKTHRSMMHGRPTVTCEECGDSFEVKPANKDSAKFCSSDCKYSSFEVDRIDKVCQQCDESYTVLPSQSQRSKFCSKECQLESTWESVSNTEVVSCGFCDDTFEAPVSFEQVYCSVDCKAKDMRYLPESERDIRKTREYRQWKQDVRSEYEVCQDCGAEDNLHAHHETEVEEDEEAAFDVDNGILLCVDCHAKRHPEISAFVKSA